MPRRERLYFPLGLPQLIKLNGHNHENSFRKNDYARFLTCGTEVFRIIQLRASCLFTSGRYGIVKLLTPKSKEDLSRFIQHIGRQYVPYYNNKYQRTRGIMGPAL